MAEIDYNDGKWHGWNGGECPVHPKTVVEVMTVPERGGKGTAGKWGWDHEYHSNPIVAFRVIKEHRKPREWWIDCENDKVSEYCGDDTYFSEGGYVRVMEVLE